MVVAVFNDWIISQIRYLSRRGCLQYLCQLSRCSKLRLWESSCLELRLVDLSSILGEVTRTGCLLDQMIKEGFAIRNLVHFLYRNGCWPMMFFYRIVHDGIPSSSQTAKWMSSFVNLQKRVDNIHRLLGFIPEAFKKWPHPSVQPAFRYDQLCISKCSGERIRRTSLDGLCILCMVWVGQPVGKRINIFAK